MKPPFPIAAALALVLAGSMLGGCVAPVGPVEVTRFHAPELARAVRGGIAVEPAAGMAADSLEWRSYAAAVGRQLTLAGYREQAAGSGEQIALVQLSRQTYQPQRRGGPVSVGVGGGAGSYGSGVGVGIGIDLSGPPPEVVETELAVTIKDRATGQALWEGRSRFTVTAKSPLAGSQLGAAKMAEALFQNFPGKSGETIEVR